MTSGVLLGVVFQDPPSGLERWPVKGPHPWGGLDEKGADSMCPAARRPVPIIEAEDRSAGVPGDGGPASGPDRLLQLIAGTALGAPECSTATAGLVGYCPVSG